VHLTPKARAFFSLAISEQNVAFAKSSLAFGAGDQHVMVRHEVALLAVWDSLNKL